MKTQFLVLKCVENHGETARRWLEGHRASQNPEHLRAMYTRLPLFAKYLSSQIVVIGPDITLLPPSVGQAYHDRAPSSPVVAVPRKFGSLKHGNREKLLGRQRGLDRVPVKRIAHKCTHKRTIIVIGLAWMRAIVGQYASDLCRIAIAPVGKVKRDEHVETKLRCRVVGISQLLWRVAINSRRRAVQGEAINANLLGLGYIGLPVVNRVMFHDTNLYRH